MGASNSGATSTARPAGRRQWVVVPTPAHKLLPEHVSARCSLVLRALLYPSQFPAPSGVPAQLLASLKHEVATRILAQARPSTRRRTFHPSAFFLLLRNKRLDGSLPVCRPRALLPSLWQSEGEVCLPFSEWQREMVVKRDSLLGPGSGYGPRGTCGEGDTVL